MVLVYDMQKKSYTEYDPPELLKELMRTGGTLTTFEEDNEIYILDRSKNNGEGE